MFFLLLYFFSTGRTAGKQSNMFQHGLMIRYPIGKKTFPCSCERPIYFISFGLMDDETFRRTLERLVLNYRQHLCVCLFIFYAMKSLNFFSFSCFWLLLFGLGSRLRFDEMKN
ncbi:hypothetical protein GGI42DRAFT_11450 [Trichoderma sp. SZMC 28013]